MVSLAAALPALDAAERRDVHRTLERSPLAVSVLEDALETAADLPVREAVVVESLAYSTLLAGPEFRRWRQERPRRDVPPCDDPVLTRREGDLLRITLNRPARHNAWGAAVRDATLDALAVAEADPDVRVLWVGAGPTFCSGGDLDEFGTAADPVTAHRVRLQQHVGLAVERLRDRVTPVLHGACTGAGVEVPSFASHVVATSGTTFRLPELEMGLLPGAGGTVSVVRRIGLPRFAWMVLTGRAVDTRTALAWGLVDEVVT